LSEQPNVSAERGNPKKLPVTDRDSELKTTRPALKNPASEDDSPMNTPVG